MRQQSTKTYLTFKTSLEAAECCEISYVNNNMGPRENHAAASEIQDLPKQSPEIRLGH